jgi:hypothetical protein
MDMYQSEIKTFVITKCAECEDEQIVTEVHLGSVPFHHQEATAVTKAENEALVLGWVNMGEDYEDALFCPECHKEAMIDRLSAEIAKLRS